MIVNAITAIVGLIETCLGDECDYKIVAGQGAAPIECNLISVYPESSRLIGQDMRCYRTYEETVKISVSRCCEAIDGVEWNREQEEKEMVCQLDTLGQLEDCFQCDLAGALEDVAVNPKDEAYLSGTVFDSQRQGGCYTATMTVRYIRQTCCPGGD